MKILRKIYNYKKFDKNIWKPKYLENQKNVLDLLLLVVVVLLLLVVYKVHIYQQKLLPSCYIWLHMHWNMLFHHSHKLDSILEYRHIFLK